ncbi:MAG: acetyl/propionyl/methylcrotonyl-CoA carboxylase subunit alpha [Rhodospirillaceae bacterium]|nr:acetyl/propionyl/methylcrotonyl-CoA carboxylase subunit alpha [Rhodospirillaceae bacterium]
MIHSLLIANRGEIARRIIKTAKRLGVRTVAVYSEADARLPYVREADAAVCIGPAPAAESYLNQTAIIDAARKTGAQAIHPGYGFLSENAGFAEAVQAAGLVWVGPPPSAIRAMGLKDAAKKLMAEAGVPVTPGYWGDDQSAATLKKEAGRIGYPVLIKAVAGGGGKGMRRVERTEDFAASLESCQREATASFGDARVLIEKYVAAPRHIEVQVFADKHGNTVHLFERDCSIQRRHQKVIEEAPAPGMDAATRKALCAAAVRAAEAVKYEGAGTVEFIADASEGLRADRIWFMEMNTRLQVEHPVTESITGVDLVEWQLRVASGERLPLKQDQIVLNGHAMEARLYAENTPAGFLPSTGALAHFHLPADIRVDTGVEQGGEVTAFYDPMIAKLIVHRPTRTAAAAALSKACAEVQVWPVKTNAGFLARVLAHAKFIGGHINTGFIAEHLADLNAPADIPQDVLATAASALAARDRRRDPTSPWAGLPGLRLNTGPRPIVHVESAGHTHTVPLPTTPGAGTYIYMRGNVLVFHAGEVYELHEPRFKAGAAEGAGSDTIMAPMPGHIIAVLAKPGDAVVKGQPLITLEAMKMEHTLTAPFAGRVAEIKVERGAKVGEGALLAKLEAAKA